VDDFQPNKVETFEKYPQEEDDITEHLCHGVDTSTAELKIHHGQMVRRRDRLNFLISQIEAFLNA